MFGRFPCSKSKRPKPRKSHLLSAQFSSQRTGEDIAKEAGGRFSSRLALRRHGTGDLSPPLLWLRTLLEKKGLRILYPGGYRICQALPHQTWTWCGCLLAELLHYYQHVDL
jgi:hypothetical protein